MLYSLKTITNRKIRIAIVGCGRISRNHIKAILMHYDKLSLVALCDTSSEKMVDLLDFTEKTSRELNILYPINKQVKMFKEYSYLLEALDSQELEIDLVVLTTPSGLHSEQAIAAAERKLHVCCEKPMATNFKDGLKMVKACDKSETQLFIVKQNRFNSTLQLLKKQIDKNRFGQICMVAINVFWQRPQEYYNQAEWRGTREFDGGALMNQASHYVDLLDWLVGPVESISASIATLGRKIETEDTAAVQIKWRNGALGIMGVTMLAYPKNIEGSITILGSKGTVKIGGPAVNSIEKWIFEDEDEDDKEIEKASYDTTSVYGFGHYPYYKNMIESLLGNEKAYCDGREGLKSLELLSAAYHSAYNKVIVNLPFEQ